MCTLQFFVFFVNYFRIGNFHWRLITRQCVLQQSEITTFDAAPDNFFNIHHMDGLLSWELSPDKGSPIIQPGTQQYQNSLRYEVDQLIMSGSFNQQFLLEVYDDSQ